MGKRRTKLDLGPMQTLDDCETALVILARACAAGEGGDELVRASQVIESILRHKFWVEEQRIDRALRAH